MDKRRHITAIITAALLLTLTPLSGQSRGASDSDRQSLKALEEAYSKILQLHVTKPDPKLLAESAIRGMASRFDPYTSYISLEQMGRRGEEIAGEYFGVGILIRPERAGSGRVVIVESPHRNSPAFRAGLRVGDVIVRVNGEPIDDWEYPDQVLANIKGPEGTSVRLTVERFGEAEPLEFEVERAAITIEKVKHYYRVRPNIGYLRIEDFHSITSDELARALQELDEATLDGLVLDLRGNSGGRLDQAIDTADSFLQQGQVIVRVVYRDGSVDEHRVSNGTQHHYPIVGLIDANCGSACEVLAAALQDQDRVLLVGQPTFGKSLVQVYFPLPYYGNLLLARGQYQTPSGRVIQRPYLEGRNAFFLERDLFGRGYQRLPEKRPEFRTASGRIVRGQSGVSPDVPVSMERHSRLTWAIQRQNLLYRFATLLSRGEVGSDVRFHFEQEELARLAREPWEKRKEAFGFSPDGQTMKLLADFVRQQGVQFSDSEWEEKRHFLTPRLRAELFLMLFGEKEFFRQNLEADTQFLRALELLPEASRRLAGPAASRPVP